MYEDMVKSIIAETLLISLLVRNIVMLKKARALRRDVKAGNTEKVKSRISFYRTKRGHRGVMAHGVYEKDGEKIKSRMICATSTIVCKSEEKYVIVGKTDSSVFALDEQQTKDAVLTWTVLTALMAIVVIFFAAGIIYFIFK